MKEISMVTAPDSVRPCTHSPKTILAAASPDLLRAMGKPFADALMSAVRYGIVMSAMSQQSIPCTTPVALGVRAGHRS
ncbi:hypothetical protein BFF78_36115 [Streptomyces fodineus]|uniref:Uncharacterized protein n=1 Tax=Streptomyces fodineus TaxID=1904616 RepID=A0A1D7YJR4_9ACTN|nr:hypothetical protein [Streptomyces fodineus]AOR35780.1 hypothetical protein BFF78_36115 [Streptomyces fodineus]